MSIPITSLNVLVVQPQLEWHNPEANILAVQNIIAKHGKTDLIVLPEMWSSGYTIMAHKSHQATEECIKKMQDWAIEKEALVIGSLITKEGDTYYNRAYLIDSNGIQAVYDKRHLFGFAGEDRVFSQGTKQLLYNYKDWRLCINICYDLRFPVWSRNTSDYDVLIYVANWPDKRILAWQTLLRARAIENQSFVIGCNCVGEDAWHNTYSGQSAILSPRAQEFKVLAGKDGGLSAILNKKDLETVRKTLPFLKDRDEFTLKDISE